MTTQPSASGSRLQAPNAKREIPNSIKKRRRREAKLRSRVLLISMLTITLFLFTSLFAVIIAVTSGNREALDSIIRSNLPIVFIGFLVLLTFAFFQYLSGTGRLQVRLPSVKMNVKKKDNSSERSLGDDRFAENDDPVHKVFWKVRHRLLGEIDALARRANVNLYIGIATTLIAVALLVWTVYAATLHQPNSQNGAIHLSTQPGTTLARQPDTIPSSPIATKDDPDPKTSQQNNFYAILTYVLLRVPLAIFIEIFSFFFLKLYRQSMHEIKFFQNEITNIELKYLAVCLLKEGSNEENRKVVVTELMRAERNVILKKDEMTIDGERLKFEADTNAKAMEIISKAIDKIKT